MNKRHIKTAHPDSKAGFPAAEWRQRLFYKDGVRRRLKVWQRLFLAALFVGMLLLVGTAVVDFDRNLLAASETAVDGSGWENPVSAYVVAEEGASDVQLYTEGLSPLCRCGRGVLLEMESWEPFIADDGSEFYHVWYEGQYAYIPVENLSSNASRVLQESQVYVRTATNLYQSSESLTLGPLMEKGTVLNVLGYDYLESDGSAHMYQVKCGDTIGWIRSDYVVLSFLDAMGNGTEDNDDYAVHASRGDAYGGGDAGELDYFPRSKGDFEDNVMPESCYCIHIPSGADSIRDIDSYLALAEGTEINTFVFTVCSNYILSCPFDAIDHLGVSNIYDTAVSCEEFAAAVEKVKQAGYYVVARVNTFQDSSLAEAFPALAYAEADGSLLLCSGIPWLSIFSREVWEIKVDIAVEAVEKYGFDEVMFCGLMEPYALSDEAEAGADLRNEYGESYAQALQRFLMYAADELHDRNTYISAEVIGDSVSTYVTIFGQYWPSFSTVVDVMCATPFPEDYANYWTSNGYYIAYKHPYEVVSDWAGRAQRRQTECASPAKVRTWIQTWDCALYDYDNAAIEREILALYDNGLTGGYGAWSSSGSLENYQKMLSCFETDYYALYQQAEQEGKTLSDYMGVSTADEPPEESSEE